MDAFSGILGQPKVRDFLRKSVVSGHVSQSYLFLGPAGSNKTQAAYALACAYLCEDENNLGGQCGKCNVCKKILAHKHPDVKYYSPEGQNAYLISQIREIIHDTELAPVQAKKKVYIIDRVDLLGTGPANAFLKTLEDPISDVCMILLGRCANNVLPTIRSRCVCVPFRQIPPTEAQAIISQNVCCDATKAKIALAASGNSITNAIYMLKSHDNSMLFLREQLLEFILKCVKASDWEICKIAKEILELIKAPNDERRRQLEEEVADREEFLSSAAKKAIEASNKRGLKREEVKMLNMVLDIEISLLDDVLHSKFCADNIVNVDVSDAIMKLAKGSEVNSLVVAIEVLRQLKDSIAYNVSAESVVDLALFEIKGAV